MKKSLKLNFYPVFAILIYFVSVVKIYYIQNYNIIIMLLSLVCGLYLLFKTRYIFTRENKTINFVLFLFSIFAMISAILNMKNIDGTLFFIIRILELFFFFEYVEGIGKKYEVSKIFFFLSLILNFITLYYIYKDPYLAWRNDMNYLVGTKFLTSYHAMSTYIYYLYLLKFSKKSLFKNIILYLLVGLSFYISIQVDCSTGIVANFLMIMFLLFGKIQKEKIVEKLCTPSIAIFTFLFCAFILLICYNSISSIPIFSYIVVKLLNRNLSLTGRAVVYSNLFEYIKNNFFFGIGYNNVYDLFKDTMLIGKNAYAFDAQNALMEYMLYFGIFGTIFFIILVYNCFSKLKKSSFKIKTDYYPFVAGLYVFLLLGSIEITIDSLFYTYIAFFSTLMLKDSYEKEKVYLT